MCEWGRTMRSSKQAGPVLMAGIGIFLLSGCAAAPLPGSTESRPGITREHIHHPAGHSGFLGRVVQVAVPFFPDDTDQCGPATLASVLTYWGVPSDLPALKEEMYLPHLRGSLPIHLLLAAQARGLQAEGFSGTLEVLQAELDAGHPIVALLNLGWALFPQGHYVVVTGYDEGRQGVYLHSGVTRDMFVPYAHYLAAWEKTGRWMLRVQPVERRVNIYERINGRG